AIQIGRGQGVSVPVKIELIAASHIQGVRAEPITLASDQTAGTLTIRFAAINPGPFNMPLLVRATAMRGPNDPVVAEAKLAIVAHYSGEGGCDLGVFSIQNGQGDQLKTLVAVDGEVRLLSARTRAPSD